VVRLDRTPSRLAPPASPLARRLPAVPADPRLPIPKPPTAILGRSWGWGYSDKLVQLWVGKSSGIFQMVPNNDRL
jgi:hypothetical protein